MLRRPVFVLFCCFAFVGHAIAQEVFIAREVKAAAPPKAEPVAPAELHVEKAIAVAPVRTEKTEPAAKPAAEAPKAVEAPKVASAKAESANEPAPPAQGPPAVTAAPTTTGGRSTKKDIPLFSRAADSRLMAVAARPAAKRDINVSRPKTKPAETAVPAEPRKVETVAIASPKIESRREQPVPQMTTFHGETAFIRLADGFDFPIGRPDAQGYYKARGFRSHGHLGEDWDGIRGGDTDLGDPIYCIGDGVVVFAKDCHMGWGNVVIVRHSYREGGSVRNIDSLYGHLNSMLVRRGQSVARGQKIATMGNAHGLYDAHLHLEIRKNIEIGMSRAAFARDFSNYYDPTQFIASHRHLQTGGGTYRVALNTFTHDAKINFDRARNYSHAHSGGGTSESAAALKRTLATSKR